jgi:hypothetical protein
MRIGIAIMVLLVGICCGLISACVNLGPSTSPATRFYLLESRINESMQTDAASVLKDVAVGIRPVRIPAYLDRLQLVIRLNDNELRMDEFNQWAEPLSDSIFRVIKENLHTLTGSNQLYSSIKRQSTKIDLLLSIQIIRFEADAAGKVTLSANWQIEASDNHEKLLEKRSILSHPCDGPNPKEMVTSMGILLAELSKEMAHALVDVTLSESCVYLSMLGFNEPWKALLPRLPS